MRIIRSDKQDTNAQTQLCSLKHVITNTENKELTAYNGTHILVIFFSFFLFVGFYKINDSEERKPVMKLTLNYNDVIEAESTWLRNKQPLTSQGEEMQCMW